MPDVIRALGAIAGLLAIVGLGALTVVYVVHAREVERLRAWAGRAPERARRAKRHRAATVAVLNGTTVPGLAAGLRSRIAAAGFKTGTIDVFFDQQLRESVVQYAPGYQADAAAVARRLGITRRAPRTAAGRARAAGASVIVIAGADQAP